MSLYLDASVLLPLLLPEAASERVHAWLTAAEGDLIVSDLVDAELRAAISRLVRMGQLGDHQAAELHLRFDEWRDEVTRPLENLPVDIRAAARLVRKPLPKLLTPDAVHVATCRRLDLTLVTHDRRLLEIARREGVGVLSPGADPPPPAQQRE